MAKPFVLSFVYTPRWKSNRTRSAEEQFTVTLKDLQERQRASEQADILARAQKLSQDEKDDVKLILASTQSNLETQRDIVSRHFISVHNLTLDVDGKEVKIESFDQLWENCSDIVAELSKRILQGPDQDELKN